MEDACKDGMWKLRRDLKKEGRMCEWFDEGPCSSNAILANVLRGAEITKAIYVWTKETVVEARECLARLGEPEDDSKDKAALEETLEVLAWAEKNLAAGLDILCAHDF